MYILVGIKGNMAEIFDTNCNTKNKVVFSALAMQVQRGTIRVHGLRSLTTATSDCKPIPQLGICICENDTKEALVELYKGRGLSTAEARRKAGFKD